MTLGLLRILELGSNIKKDFKLNIYWTESENGESSYIKLDNMKIDSIGLHGIQ